MKRRTEAVGPQTKRSFLDTCMNMPPFNPSMRLGEKTLIALCNKVSNWMFLYIIHVFGFVYLQVRSSLFPNVDMSVTSAVFSTWMKKGLKICTAAVSDTMTTCRYRTCKSNQTQATKTIKRTAVFVTFTFLSFFLEVLPEQCVCRTSGHPSPHSPKFNHWPAFLKSGFEKKIMKVK